MNEFEVAMPSINTFLLATISSFSPRFLKLPTWISLQCNSGGRNQAGSELWFAELS